MEKEYEQELKEFLLSISGRIKYTDQCKREHVIGELKKEYNSLCVRIRLLAGKYYDQDTEVTKDEYYVFTRKMYPVLESCFILISHYENVLL